MWNNNGIHADKREVTVYFEMCAKFQNMINASKRSKY